MDKLVRRVTVVQSSGEHRDAKVVYENDEDEDTDDEGPGAPNFKRLERSVRHMLKAQVIAAQDAYQRHSTPLPRVETAGLSTIPAIS